MRLYDGVAFRIERNGADGCPVAGVARPAVRMGFARRVIEGMAGGQNRRIVAHVTLRRVT